VRDRRREGLLVRDTGGGEAGGEGVGLGGEVGNLGARVDAREAVQVGFGG
jgi:hypothetical protein